MKQKVSCAAAQKRENQELKSSLWCLSQGWVWQGLTLKLSLVKLDRQQFLTGPIAPPAVYDLPWGPIVSYLCQYHFLAILCLLNICTGARASRKRQKTCQGAAPAGQLPWGGDQDSAGSPAPAGPGQGMMSPHWAKMRVLGPRVWGWAGPLQLIHALLALTRTEKEGLH